MSEINKEEVITESFFWFSRKGKAFSKSCVEYEVLKLTNASTVILEDIEVKVKEVKNAETTYTYNVVAKGTKQKLLLLKYMLGAWANGVRFEPEFEK